MKKSEKIIVFDVNETLLDIETLQPFFERCFGDKQVMRQWFSELILYSQALTLSGGYLPFGQLAVAVLYMLAQIRSVELDDKDIECFKNCMAVLPAHADASPALEMLRQAGFRLMTLTNSAPEAGRAVLEKAGLAGYFEQQFSVDDVRRFKPAVETYRSVESALGVNPNQLRMVAAHTWDAQGAVAAGWRAALVTRPGNASLSVGGQPDIIETNLIAVAKRIISIHSTS